MSNHSQRSVHGQDVICTALGCRADVEPMFYPSMTCRRHAEQVFRVIHAMRVHIIDSVTKTPSEIAEQEAKLKARRKAQAVVYYIQFGQGIKIGTTTNLRQRLISFCVQESAVLATEPGGYELERSRHEFFRDTRIGNTEVFTVSTKLLKHIEAVKKYHGEPKITSYV